MVEATLVGGAGGVGFQAWFSWRDFFIEILLQARTRWSGFLNALGALGGGDQQVELASSMDEQRLFVLAHELAHQWSPSLVETNALLSPVVDEPLAQYLAGRAMQGR